ncbi:MAG: 4Fe-4S binding protein, partial [Actinobacteria bacterium]|nr:4Fe-4S binding protein [Actinomycetota bacterium]
MTSFAITQSCCSDASCVAVCPVNCIHPTPDEPDFGLTDMLYIDPRSCIGCGACADACPVDAIFPVDLLRGTSEEAYVDLNREHFADDVPHDEWDEPVFPATLAQHAADLRVAIVGIGPAASYTASALLTTGAEVTMIDRLPVPGGLIRFGVAPDHQSTKAIASRFATVLRNPRLELVLNVEVGTHVTHAELLDQHDAVVYAVGAVADRRLDVPGEDLVGSMSARTFVGWYNAQPEIAADAVELGPAARGRAVIVGNGNVALDAARILLSDTDGPGGLAGTDIADHALAALRSSDVSEVVLVARRGPDEAAYSLSELRPLLARADVEVVVDGGSEVSAVIAGAAPGSKAAALQGVPVLPVDWSAPAEPTR